MDGGLSDDADGGWADVVPGVSERKLDELGRRPSLNKQDNHNRMQVPK